VGHEHQDHGACKKKLRKTERPMTTALFMLRCVELGLNIADLDLLTIGSVFNDMFNEKLAATPWIWMPLLFSCEGALNQAARQGLSARIRFASANMMLNFASCF
jgi:hypothetical protein